VSSRGGLGPGITSCGRAGGALLGRPPQCCRDIARCRGSTGAPSGTTRRGRTPLERPRETKDRQPPLASGGGKYAVCGSAILLVRALPNPLTMTVATKRQRGSAAYAACRQTRAPAPLVTPMGRTCSSHSRPVGILHAGALTGPHWLARRPRNSLATTMFQDELGP
jgi:hypothetical protein